MIPNVKFSDEIAAIPERNKAPVVALESTVISHGLQYPANVETAIGMQNAIRESGAIPATIAIIDGQIRVGLTDDEIDRLGRPTETPIRKCSRRDIPIAIARKETAATTVAGTMIIADLVGAIDVFATGGIGGVHRGQPFDVSADLLELGRTPIAVVCSGAKSILDLPLTLEVLESQGVPVVAMGVDTLPSFYSRESGLPIDVRIDSPEEAAQIIAAAKIIAAQHGILIAVPVPEEDALPVDIAEKAIQQATDEAHAQGVSGKDVTPFVLKRVTELTDGQSRKANVSLLQNNARTAGKIAVSLIKELY